MVVHALLTAPVLQVNLNAVDRRRYPQVEQLCLLEVNVSAGQLLYFPPYWAHQTEGPLYCRVLFWRSPPLLT